MAVQITVSDETAAVLRQQAAAAGCEEGELIDRYFRPTTSAEVFGLTGEADEPLDKRDLHDDTPSSPGEVQRRLESFDKFVKGLPKYTGPPLPGEAFSRDSIYSATMDDPR